MESLNISMMAILVAVFANFVLGFIWYTQLFGKLWAKEVGVDMSVKPTTGEFIKNMLVMVVGNFFMAYVLAHNTAAWSFVPGIEELGKTGNIMNATIFTWLGFYLPVDIGVVTWERKSWKLFGINTGYHFMMLLVASIILAFM